MIEQFLQFSLAVLGLMVLAWFVLVTRLFEVLRTRHPSTYLAMGSPTLIMNNSIQNNFAFLRFLLRREDRQLNDPALSKLCQVMVAFFWSYAVLFIVTVISGLFLNPMSKS